MLSLSIVVEIHKELAHFNGEILSLEHKFLNDQLLKI